MVERVKGGVVRIDTAEGNGSGVIFATDDDDGALVLTNYHVVAAGGRIAVMVDDADSYRGSIQGFDADLDLAVLRICCGDFQTLPFGEVAEIRPGSEVIVMGYPLGLPGAATVTRGIVSAIRPVMDFEIIQVDAPLNPGNSGGPLLSASGEVLGINTFGISDTEGLGFAISARTVRATLPQIQGDLLVEVTATSVSPATLRPNPTRRPTATPRTYQPTPNPTPTVPQPLLLRVISSSYHSCGLRLDDTPVCWGENDHGQAKPPDGEKLVAISSGGLHTCGLRTDGSPVCWGKMSLGLKIILGQPLLGPLVSAADILPSGEKFTVISNGGGHTCGLRLDGTPVCWGRNEVGQTLSPSREKFAALSSGSDHTCGLRADGTPVCWGANLFGEATPPAGEKLATISSSTFHTCGLRLDGTPVCWGFNRDGEATPPAGEKFETISSGGSHTCGLRTDGTPVCWGSNLFGQAAPPSGEKFGAISNGGDHTCGLRLDGAPICWGNDEYGQATPPRE